MKRHVAIIGGGLAGLACAWALRRRGIDATVFEASSQPGGRAIAEQAEGFTIDAGAQYLLSPELFRNTFALVRDIGLAGDVLPATPVAGQVYKGRVYRHRVSSATALLKFKGLGISDKLLLPRMAYLISKFGRAVDFHHPERGVELDDETVASFVRRELSQNVLNRVAGPLISTLFFYSSEETSKLLYLMLAKHMSDTRIFTIRGGVGRLAAQLAKEARVVYGRTIGGIGTAGDSYIIGDETFTDVVIAVRGDAVLDLQGLGDLLSDDDRRFFETCRYERVVTVVVGSERPADGACYGVSIPRVENFVASAIAFHDYIDPLRVPAGRGLLSISGGGIRASSEGLLQELGSLYRVAPLMTRSYESATPKLPPGRFRQIAEFQRRPRRSGLYFCGDYLMGPLIEAAVTTGQCAAAAIQK